MWHEWIVAEAEKNNVIKLPTCDIIAKWIVLSNKSLTATLFVIQGCIPHFIGFIQTNNGTFQYWKHLENIKGRVKKSI